MCGATLVQRKTLGNTILVGGVATAEELNFIGRIRSLRFRLLASLTVPNPLEHTVYAVGSVSGGHREAHLLENHCKIPPFTINGS